MKGRTKRLGWGFGDQAASSLTNFAATVVAVRYLNSEELGGFFLAYNICLLALLLFRSALGQPYLIATTSLRWLTSPGMMSEAILLGVVLGIPTAAVGLALGAQGGSALAVGGLCLPLIFGFEARRYTYFQQKSYRAAFAIDSAWGLLFVATVWFVLPRIPSFGGGAPLLVWALAGGIVVIVDCIFNRVAYESERERSWIRRLGPISRPLVAESMLARGVPQLSVYTLAVTAGLASVAVFSTARAAFGPLTVLSAGLTTIGLVEIASNRRAMRSIWLARGIGGALAASAIALLGILWVFFEPLGRVLGDNWRDTRSVLIPVGLSTALASYALVQVVWLRALVAMRKTLMIQVYASILTLVLVTVGGAGWGAQGAAWGLLASRVAAIPLSDWALRTSIARGAVGAETADVAIAHESE